MWTFRLCPLLSRSGKPRYLLQPGGVSLDDERMLGEVPAVQGQRHDLQPQRSSVDAFFQYEKGLFDPNDYPDDGYVYDGCNCGNCHFTILSDGAVYACRRMESKVGNALTDDLYDLFTGPKMDAYRVYESSKSALNASCCDSAAAALRWRPGITATCMRPTRSAGRRSNNGCGDLSQNLAMWASSLSPRWTSMAPQVRNISAIHYEPDVLYFSPRGQNFLSGTPFGRQSTGAGYTRYKEMICLPVKQPRQTTRKMD